MSHYSASSSENAHKISPNREKFEQARKLVEQAQSRYEQEKAKNKREGYTAQAFDSIDAHRAGPGRERRNAAERERYRQKAEAAGRTVRVYCKDRTSEERKRRKAETDAARYERKKADLAEAEALLADLEIEPCPDPTITVTQAKRAYENDKRWRSRQRKKGVPEHEINAGLVERQKNRLLLQK